MDRFDQQKNGILLHQAREIAVQYGQLTGKPLGITGEVAEFEAARLLDLELTSVRQEGFDAIRKKDGSKVQVKGRRIISKKSQQVSAINTDKEWDVVVLVLLNDVFQPTAIYEANRVSIEAALSAPGSKARNERNSLSVCKFKAIGNKVWPETDL